MHLDALLYIGKDSQEEEASPDHDVTAIEIDFDNTLTVEE